MIEEDILDNLVEDLDVMRSMEQIELILDGKSDFVTFYSLFRCLLDCMETSGRNEQEIKFYLNKILDEEFAHREEEKKEQYINHIE